jgi:hypothetical protein
MAAAMVSGAVALMLSDDPSLNPDTVKARLMRSARKISAARAVESSSAGTMSPAVPRSLLMSSALMAPH